MASFTDIQTHWAKTCIEKLADLNVISGYQDGTFKPDASVTRAEFAALLLKAFPGQPKIRNPLTFKDVPTTFWAKTAIDTAYQTGFLSGYPDNLFKPEEKIPRVQVLVALANGLEYVATHPVSEILDLAFDDVTDIPNYALNSLAGATENRLVVNYPNVRQLKPNALATRAEVAAFLSQALLKAEEESWVSPEYIVRVNLAPPPRTGELRGIWLTDVDSNVLFTTNNIKNALSEISEAKLNTVYPTVWNGDHTLYRSQVIKRITGTELDPRLETDALAEVVKEAKAKGLKVIPWFEYGLIIKADSELAQQRPHWLTQNAEGEQVVAGKTRQDDTYWLNPFHPQVQQFLLDLIVEVITEYEVDGIQLDDHFGLGVDFGYDQFTKTLYRREHQGEAPPTQVTDPEWMRWRAQKLTDFLMRIFWVVKEYNPECVISLSPNAYGFAYQNYLSDWKQWERAGFVEELILQVYRDQLEAFVSELTKPEVFQALRHIPVSIGILTGLTDKPMSLAVVEAQVEKVREQGFNGISFFYYETWKAMMATEAGEEVFQALFPEMVDRPSLEA